MRKQYYLIIVFIFINQFSFSQKMNGQNEATYSTFSIKVSPLGLIEPDQAASIAFEIRTSVHIGVQVEGSYIFNTWYLSNKRTISNTNGFRIVPEIRYYDNKENRNAHKYIGIQLSYKKLNKNIETWVSKSNYQQLETIEIQKYNMTGAVIAGIQNNAHRIGFDFNLGLGLKYKNLYNNATNSNISDVFLPSEFGESITGYYPQLSATFKLCFKIF